MRSFWRHSILYLTAAQVVGVAALVGLVFVFLTTQVTDIRTQTQFTARLGELLETVESTVQIACFAKDEALAAEVTNGLLKNSEVLGVVITSGTVKLGDKFKPSSTPELLARANETRLVRKITSPFDHNEVVGEIQLIPNPQAYDQFIRENVGFVAMLLSVQLVVVVAAVLAVVLIRIIRPIKGMSDGLHKMALRGNKLLKLPRGQEDTEIGRLAHDINHLTTTLLAAHNEERAVRLKREVDERKYHAIFDNANSGIYIANSEGVLESWNRALANLFLLPQMHDANSVIKLTALAWHAPDQLALMMRSCIDLNQPQAGDLEFRCANSSPRWFHVALTPIGEQKAQGLVSDVSEHKNAEAQARLETITDPLTGLLNRRGFFEHAEEKIANFKAQPNTGFTLVVIDLDGFKRINDAMGLRSGDKILASSAARLQSCLKSSDVVARLGGDTFGVILQATSLEEHVIAIGARIVSTLGAFFEIDNTPLRLGASLGISTYPGDGNDLPTLMRNAELALDRARAGGGGRYVFFDTTMAKDAENKRSLENDLQLAIRRNEFRLFFQPIIDLPSKRLAGAEALIRWKHPTRGMVPPDAFIPLSEETGLIVDIGLWTLEVACQQLATWQAQSKDYYVSLNVSGRQIPDGLPSAKLIESVRRHGVDPAKLVIEITEGVLLGDFAKAQAWLNSVREHGFRIYLDDFGTGYSSLSYLKRFPVDTLKIDKSFIRDMSEDNSDRTLVEAIIAMANSLHLTVVAEGVETGDQLALLTKMGCNYVQGYHFSKPVPADEFDAVAVRIGGMLT